MLKRTTGKLINMFKWLKKHRPFRRKTRTVFKNIEELFGWYGFDTPYEMGRNFYKYTSCGPWTAFIVEEEFEHPSWTNMRMIRSDFTHDDYRNHEDFFKPMLPKIVGVQFGSIVEGSDQYAVPVTVMFPCTADDIDAAVQDVDKQCDDIWNATHGCPFCYHDGDEEAWDKADERPVNPDCKECSGGGISV